MIVLKIFVVLLLLVLYSLVPGLWLLRKTNLPPLGKLTSVIALSWGVTYIAAYVFYHLGVNTRLYWLLTLAWLVLAVKAMPAWRTLWSFRRVRYCVFGFLFLFLWMAGILTLIRHYSGGDWAGDWLEHYQRCYFFLHSLPVGTTFISIYDLPARPPLMNLVAVPFLSQAGEDFPVFQFVFAFLNMLIFFPCVLLLQFLTRHPARAFVPLLCLMALNPMMVQNVTYAWTKLFTGFYVLLGLWLYLAGWKERTSGKMTAAFACLAAAMLTHFSAVPYLVVLACHYLVFVWAKRHDRWRELAIIVLVGGSILWTWFAWSVTVYGWKSTVGSNTTVASSSQFTIVGNLEKIADNIYCTVVPHIVRSVDRIRIEQPSLAGRIRDNFFLMYQTNLLWCIGCVGGLVVVGLSVAHFRSSTYIKKVFPVSSEAGGRVFWLFFTTATLLLGIAVVGESTPFGAGHVCLQSLLCLGITYLAGRIGYLPVWWRVLLILGCLFDLVFGILLHVFSETTMMWMVKKDGALLVESSNGFLLSQTAMMNCAVKTQKQIVMWGDYWANVQWVVMCAVVVGSMAFLYLLTVSSFRFKMVRGRNS